MAFHSPDSDDGLQLESRQKLTFKPIGMSQLMEHDVHDFSSQYFTFQARRNEFRNGAAERSEGSERSELIAAGGLGGAVSPQVGSGATAPRKF